MTPPMLRPDYKEFSRLAADATLVPVVKSVAADLLTPVSAFLAIAAGEPDAFLPRVGGAWRADRPLHVSGGASLYASAGAGQRDRGATWQAAGEKAREAAVQVIKELLRQHRPATVPGLPPFTAGAVGYFAYDAVRQLENIGEHAKDDFSLPDCLLMFLPATGLRSPAPSDPHYCHRRRIARESAPGL